MTYLFNAFDTTGAVCERCGCTEQRACPGGCAWDPELLAKGHTVCTTCTRRRRRKKPRRRP